MADDTVIFVMHKAVRVSGDSRRATKGYGFPNNPVRHKVSRAEFVVRDADEQETTEAAKQLKDAIDRRVEELRLKAAVDRRVEELRRAK